MKRVNQILWGVVLVAAGLLLGLNALDIVHVDVFFDGWWTLFILIPCGIGLLSGKDITGNLIGLAIGGALLLCCQDLLDFGTLWKLLLPALIIFFGAKMIFSSVFGSNAEAMKRIKANNGQVRYGTAVFSSEKMNFSGELFQGAEFNAVFGGVQCDLRNAVIDSDCAIQVSVIFGGVDIFVPSGINIKVSSNSIFGGVDNKAPNSHIEGAPTLYIKGTCLFGGVDIK